MTDTPDTPAPEARPGPRKPLVVGIVLVLAAGAVPPALYALIFGRHAVTPAEAKRILAAGERAAALVDVSGADDFRQRHIQGAFPWSHEDVMALTSRDQIPTELGRRRMLLICESGRQTARTVRKLHELGLTDTVHVRGGIQAWIGDAQNRTGSPLDYFVTDGQVTGPPHRDASAFEQWVALGAGFVIKPLYGLVSFVLVIVLWRARAADLKALKWAMICFFLGEQACAVNYVAFGEQSYLTEYLHSFGMLVCFSLTTWAVFEALDRRLIGLSPPDQKCAALDLCHRCVKYAPVPCGLKRLFLLLVPATAVLAFMPLTAAIHLPSYNVEVFGLFYNYSHQAAYQMFELRVCPVAALGLMAASLAALLFKKRNAVAAGKALFAAGMGPLGFALLRLWTFAPYRGNLLWFTFWEEATELLFILAVAWVLWIFRRGLFRRDPAR